MSVAMAEFTVPNKGVFVLYRERTYGEVGIVTPHFCTKECPG